MPRFSIIATMAVALRWMLGRSLAMLGMESSDELDQNGALVLLPPGARGLCRGIELRVRNRWSHDQGECQEVTCHARRLAGALSETSGCLLRAR
jgi:hypothetical protein